MLEEGPLALTDDEKRRLLSMAPEDLWKKLLRHLEGNLGRPGKQRKVVAELGLDDRTGKVSAEHTFIHPARESVKDS